MASCKYFRLLGSIPPRFWAVPGADHTAFGKNFESVLYGCVSNAFYFALRSHSRGRSAETYKEC